MTLALDMNVTMDCSVRERIILTRIIQLTYAACQEKTLDKFSSAVSIRCDSPMSGKTGT